MKALALAIALLAGASAAFAQGACPEPADVTARDLFGLWLAEFQGEGHVGTLLLEQHPEYAESVHGTINRNGERSQLAGDIEDGGFTLEESADGVHIAATWLGDVVEGSCGREIRGSWKAERDARSHAFILRKR